MFKKEEKFVVEGDNNLFKSEMQAVIDNYDKDNSSFVGFHIVRHEEGKSVQVICNLNPKDMPTLHESFNGAMTEYLKTIAEKSPISAAKIMAEMMVRQQLDNDDNDDFCTCGHCDED